MVAKHIKLAATSAGTYGQGKRQRQTCAQEKTSGPEQSSAGVVQSWPHHLIDELLTSWSPFAAIQTLAGSILGLLLWLEENLETSGSQRPLALTCYLETWHWVVCQTCDNEFSEWVGVV